MKILLAADGSEYSVKAANYIAAHFGFFQAGSELHLLHVHLPIPQGLALVQAEQILGRDAVDRYYKEEAEAALAPAKRIFEKHRIPFHAEYRVGPVAQAIHDYALEHKMDMIVMGSHGHGALANVVMGSVANKVIATTTDIPVLIVR